MKYMKRLGTARTRELGRGTIQIPNTIAPHKYSASSYEKAEPGSGEESKGNGTMAQSTTADTLVHISTKPQLKLIYD